MHFVCQTSSARYGDTGVSQDDLKRGRLRQIVLSILVQDISILGKGSFFLWFGDFRNKDELKRRA